MAIVARIDVELHQLYVKAAFLNGKLKEDIYVLTRKFWVKGCEDNFYKLKRSLHGLKQSSKQLIFKIPSSDPGFRLSSESIGSLCLQLELIR